MQFTINFRQNLTSENDSRKLEAQEDEGYLSNSRA